MKRHEWKFEASYVDPVKAVPASNMWRCARCLLERQDRIGSTPVYRLPGVEQAWKTMKRVPPCEGVP